MSLTYLLWSLWGHSLTPRLVAIGLLLAATVSGGYFALHLGFKAILASALPPIAIGHHPASQPALLVLMVTLFGALLVLQSQLPQWTSRPWCRTLYVHARNGFYINPLANRTIQTLWPA
jgi:NAD(P)H-quinone oxidoreductase subunit 5